MHAPAPRLLVSAFFLDAPAVGLGPAVEGLAVDEVVAQAGQRPLRSFFAESAEEQRVIHRAALHALQQFLDQGMVVLRGDAQARRRRIRSR